MKSPKDVLALGRVIVQQLELPTRGTVLERWLAHHLAEVLDQADRATGAEQISAEEQAVDLVLKLWAHRRSLPEGVDPLGGYREAISVLNKLSKRSNPWMRIHGSRQYDELLSEMFEIHSRSVIAGLLLTGVTRVRELAPEERSALDEDETVILSELEKWTQQYFSSSPKVESGCPDPGGPDVTEKEGALESTSDSDGEQHSPDEDNALDENWLHASIAKDLEQMQKRIRKFLKSWREASPSESRTDKDA